MVVRKEFRKEELNAQSCCTESAQSRFLSAQSAGWSLCTHKLYHPPARRPAGVKGEEIRPLTVGMVGIWQVQPCRLRGVKGVVLFFHEPVVHPSIHLAALYGNLNFDREGSLQGVVCLDEMHA